MSKEDKVRKHKLSKNKSLIPVLLVTLLMIIGYFVLSQSILSFPIGIPVSIFFGIDDTDAVTSLCSCFGGLLMLFFFHW